MATEERGQALLPDLEVLESSVANRKPEAKGEL